MNKLLELCKRRRINFYYTEENMYFERINGCRVDKMLDRVNVLLDDPINQVVVPRNVKNDNIVYKMIIYKPYGRFK